MNEGLVAYIGCEYGDHARSYCDVNVSPLIVGSICHHVIYRIVQNVHATGLRNLHGSKILSPQHLFRLFHRSWERLC